MRIWTEWWSWVEPLRESCSRSRTFLWLLAALAGLSVRNDLLGVTGIVRALGLGAQCYDRLLDFFHSQAVDPDALCRCWVKTSARLRISPGTYPKRDPAARRRRG